MMGTKRGAAVLTHIRRIVIAAFFLVLMLTGSALTLSAQNGNPGAAQTPKFSPFVITPPMLKPEKPVHIIRIGRLELIQKSEYEQQADGRVPHPFDPLELVRAQLGMGPQPPITITFDLKWHER
jgi:hypothetical protein